MRRAGVFLLRARRDMNCEVLRDPKCPGREVDLKPK